jgi:hypothetical protein
MRMKNYWCVAFSLVLFPTLLGAQFQSLGPPPPPPGPPSVVLVPPGEPAGTRHAVESSEEIEQKLQNLHKQIEEMNLLAQRDDLRILTPQDIARQIAELRQQEMAILQSRERVRREAADQAAKAVRQAAEEEQKKEWYAKVEIQGRLSKETAQDHFRGEIFLGWTVSTDGLTWYLDLGNNKEFLATVQKQVGKNVVVTGKALGRGAPRGLAVVPTITVDSLKAAEKTQD